MSPLCRQIDLLTLFVNNVSVTYKKVRNGKPESTSPALGARRCREFP
jgi:hypothetical protein